MSGGASSTVPITITLNGHHREAGLDKAAVSVNFARAKAKHVLSVPVTALIATSGGNYAVQEAAAPHTLLPVTTGLFAAGYVQISGGESRSVAGHRLTRMSMTLNTNKKPLGTPPCAARVALRDHRALQLDEVVKEYAGGVRALRGVSIHIRTGEQVAIVGPSGSGKTTMLSVLGTLERATSGHVEVAGRQVGTASDRDLAGLRAHRSGSCSRASISRMR